MVKVNLRDFYYWYKEDEFIEVSDEVANVMFGSIRSEETKKRKRYRYRAQYSLDRGDGIEDEAIVIVTQPHEIFERKQLYAQLPSAFGALAETQKRRIEAHVICGKSYQDIADAEGVDESATRASVNRGLQTMKKCLENFI